MNKKKKIIQVPYIDQSVKYPTGCESVSTVMLLQYLGYDISVDEFIADYLEMKAFEEREGQLFGADPNLYFCGSPYDKDSFGCYAPVICKALEKAVGDKFHIVNETDTEIEERLLTSSNLIFLSWKHCRHYGICIYCVLGGYACF